MVFFNLWILVNCCSDLLITFISFHVSTFPSFEQLDIELSFAVFCESVLWKHISPKQIIIIKNSSVLDNLSLQFSITCRVLWSFLYCYLIIYWSFSRIYFYWRCSSLGWHLIKINIIILAWTCPIVPWWYVLCFRVIVHPLVVSASSNRLTKLFVELYLASVFILLF